MFGFVLLALVSLAGAAALLIKRRQCHHRFGVPMHGTVCCMKCTRRYAIEDAADGTWRISRIPLPEPAAGGEHSSPTPRV